MMATVCLTYGPINFLITSLLIIVAFFFSLPLFLFLFLILLFFFPLIPFIFVLFLNRRIGT